MLVLNNVGCRLFMHDELVSLWCTLVVAVVVFFGVFSSFAGALGTIIFSSAFVSPFD